MFFLDFADGMRQVWVQTSMGTSPDRRVTATYVSLLAAGIFIDSQSLVDDGVSLDPGKDEGSAYVPLNASAAL